MSGGRLGEAAEMGLARRRRGGKAERPEAALQAELGDGGEGDGGNPRVSFSAEQRLVFFFFEGKHVQVT